MCVCVPPLCVVAGGLKAGVEEVEVILQVVCGADGAGCGPVVRDGLQALPHLPCVSRGMEAIQLLFVLSLSRCDGFPQSVLPSFVLRLIA